MEDDSFLERLIRQNAEDIKITAGLVCKNCAHVIVWGGLVHCRELDCSCLKPEPKMEALR